MIDVFRSVSHENFSFSEIEIFGMLNKTYRLTGLEKLPLYMFLSSVFFGEHPNLVFCIGGKTEALHSGK